MFGWGNGANGRLGNESDEIVTEPRVLEPFREATQLGIMNIQQVSCGENHTLALVEMVTKIEEEDDGEKDEGEVGTMMSKLFVWGNNDKRQLGMSQDQTEESNQDEVTSAGTGTGTGPNSSTTTT